MRPTFHLVPAEAWSAADPADDYRPTSLASEGFVHATDGEDEVLRTGDRYYRDEPGDWLVLTIDLDRVSVPWTLDDPDQIFPHIHGPIDRAAIIAVRPIDRALDGSFVDIRSS